MSDPREQLKFEEVEIDTNIDNTEEQEEDIEDVNPLEDVEKEKDEPEKEDVEDKPKPVKAKKSVKDNSRFQKRIKQVIDERDQERLERKALEDKIKELEHQFYSTKETSSSNMKQTLENQVEGLKRSLIKAIEDGDAGLAVSLQSDLNTAQMKLAGLTSEQEQLKEIKAQREKEEELKKAQPAAPKQKNNMYAMEWVKEHPEFNSDPVFQGAARAIEQRLFYEGFDPETEDFFEELSERLSPRFPEVFGIDDKNSVQYEEDSDNTVDDSSDEETETPSKEPKSKRPPVAGASRNSSMLKSKSGKAKVKMTDVDIAVSQDLDIDLKKLAKRKKYMEDNTDESGYVDILI